MALHGRGGPGGSDALTPIAEFFDQRRDEKSAQMSVIHRESFLGTKGSRVGRAIGVPIPDSRETVGRCETDRPAAEVPFG